MIESPFTELTSWNKFGQSISLGRRICDSNDGHARLLRSRTQSLIFIVVQNTCRWQTNGTFYTSLQSRQQMVSVNRQSVHGMLEDYGITSVSAISLERIIFNISNQQEEEGTQIQAKSNSSSQLRQRRKKTVFLFVYGKTDEATSRLGSGGMVSERERESTVNRRVNWILHAPQSRQELQQYCTVRIIIGNLSF